MYKLLDSVLEKQGIIYLLTLLWLVYETSASLSYCSLSSIA